MVVFNHCCCYYDFVKNITHNCNTICGNKFYPHSDYMLYVITLKNKQTENITIDWNPCEGWGTGCERNVYSSSCVGLLFAGTLGGLYFLALLQLGPYDCLLSRDSESKKCIWHLVQHISESTQTLSGLSSRKAPDWCTASTMMQPPLT